MYTLMCSGCGKKLLSYEKNAEKRYGSPVKTCKKCGQMYADPRYCEIAVDGIQPSSMSVGGNVLVLALGAFILYRGIVLFGRTQLGVPKEMQFLMPAALAVVGLILVIKSIADIILIKTGLKAKKLERLKNESEDRLRDRSYAETLRQLGYNVPDKYL